MNAEKKRWMTSWPKKTSQACLANLKPLPSAASSEELRTRQKFEEINVFIDRNGRAPGEGLGDKKILPAERMLLFALNGIKGNASIITSLAAYDRHDSWPISTRFQSRRAHLMKFSHRKMLYSAQMSTISSNFGIHPRLAPKHSRIERPSAAGSKISQSLNLCSTPVRRI